MPTQETESASLGTTTKQVAEHASSLARLELELATLELKRKVASLGIGIGLGVGAAIFGLFMLGFLFAAIAAGLATAMPTWAALLVTTGILLLITAVLGILAQGRIKKGTPPMPEQAIAEAKRTSEALKSNGTA
jgi:tetrahydromethanopterin S-methyltransferase subunit C